MYLTVFATSITIPVQDARGEVLLGGLCKHVTGVTLTAVKLRSSHGNSLPSFASLQLCGNLSCRPLQQRDIPHNRTCITGTSNHVTGVVTLIRITSS